MAEASVLLAQDQFSCPICLYLLNDPVTIHCGHSFCMDCITDCWDQEDKKGSYSCPQCRLTFTSKPALVRDTMLAEVVEKLKIMGLKSVPPAHCYAEPGDVECDVCTGRKRKAVKSCLVCLSSYCETHLRAHNDLDPGKKHKVIDAAGKLEDLICSHHDKLLEVFCRTDQTCICLLCAMDEHKGHDTVSAAAERTERQKQLGESQKKSQQSIQEMERELQQLRQAVKNLRRSAQAAVEDSERIFTEIIRSVERKRSEVTGLIRDQERAEVSRAEKLIEKLEQKVAELKNRDHELGQLSKNENHICFLQSLQSLSSSSVPDKLEDTVHTDLSFDVVTEKLSELRDRLEDTLQLGIKAEFVSLLSVPMPTTRKDLLKSYSAGLLSIPTPMTREDLLKYSCDFSLDAKTANKWLCLSMENRRIENINVDQRYPLHPERFATRQQVLCCQAVSERCYWEVEWSGALGVAIAVSYKDINRTGIGSYFGYNRQSWSLECSSTYHLLHRGKKIRLCSAPKSPRVGVYVDHKAEVLAFYSISSDTVALLHKVQTTFTQPVYPGFWVNNGSTLHISRIFNK